MRFSFGKARANKEWICPKSKGSETLAVDRSTAGKKMSMVFSLWESDIGNVVVEE